MHICLISVEIFAWGKYGGFGKATRTLGRELVKRGIQVSALVPRRPSQKPIEILDGMTVYGYEISKPWQMLEIFKICEADVYHSQEPSFASYFAQRLHPEKKHFITFRDTRNFSDWWIEFIHPSKSRLQVIANFIFEDNFLVHKAIRSADRKFVASHLLVERSYKKYHLDGEPEFLPTPVYVPINVDKAEKPTVCYVSRWDRRKRPELFIEVARSSPDVHFIAVGASRDTSYDHKIRSQLEALPNVEVHGLINQFENIKIQEIFSRSWILLNTAAREGLPVSFIEACAARCAILSSVDPDGFTSRFGFVVKNNDFAPGLLHLISENRWREAGMNGYLFVKEAFSLKSAVQEHIDHYSNGLNS